MVYTDRIHLVAYSLDELHEFAAKIGMPITWFQDKKKPHYDLFGRKKGAAIKAGAKVISTKEIVKLIKESEEEVWLR
jgi:hypothetical protein